MTEFLRSLEGLCLYEALPRLLQATGSADGFDSKIVTEKPSVAHAIAKALGITKRRTGYLESDEYLVSWCVGHLVELAPPGNYDAKLVKWSKADLPILPKAWQYLVSPGTQRQFEVLRSLMARPDVDQLV